MPLKKHTRFNYKQVALFIFIFLNCFLAAAPFIHAASVNNSYPNTKDYPSQNHPASISEENNGLHHFSTEIQDYHFSLRNKQKQKLAHLFKEPNYYSSFSANNDNISNLSVRPTPFLIRPAYYIFLSLYKLF